MRFHRTILTGLLAVILPVAAYAQNIIAKDVNSSTPSTNSTSPAPYNFFMPRKDAVDAAKPSQSAAPTQNLARTTTVVTPPTISVRPPVRTATNQSQPILVGYLTPARQQLLIQKEQKKIAILQNMLDQRTKILNYVNQHPQSVNPKSRPAQAPFPHSHLQAIIQGSIQMLQNNLQQSQQRLNALLSGPVRMDYARMMYRNPNFVQNMQSGQKVQP